MSRTEAKKKVSLKSHLDAVSVFIFTYSSSSSLFISHLTVASMLNAKKMRALLMKRPPPTKTLML